MDPITGISVTDEKYKGPAILKQEELKPQHNGINSPGYTGPPGADEQIRLQYERLKDMTKDMDDPAAEIENILAADYIGQKLQKPTEHVYRNLVAYSQVYFQTNELPKTSWKAATDEFERSWLSIQASKKGLEMMVNPYDEELYDEYQTILSQMPEADGTDRNIFEKLLKSSASIAPSVGHVLANGLATGTAGAAVGGLAGYALGGPGGAAAGAAKGYNWGSKIGNAKESFSLAAGGIFSEVMMVEVPETGQKLYELMMQSEGEDRNQILNIARAAATTGGTLSAAIEYLSGTYGRVTGTTASFADDVADKVIKQILKDGYATKAVSRAMLKYGLNAGTEAAQEIAQEMIEKGATEAAKYFTNEAEKLGIPYAELSEWGNEAKEVGVQTFLGMLGLGLPGAMVSTYRDSAEAITQKKLTIPRGYRKTDTSTAVPLSQIIEGDYSQEEYNQAVAQYEETAESKTKAPIKVFRNEDGDLVAADAAAFQVAMEHGETAVEIEIIEGPLTKEQSSRVKENPDWAMNSEEYGQRTQFRQNTMKEFRELNTMEDFKYNLRNSIPAMTTEEAEGASWLVDLTASVTGQTVDDYIQNTFSGQGFTVGLNLQGNKAGVDFLDGGKAMIHLTEKSDFSSFIHEFGHIVRRQLPEADQAILLEHFGETDWKLREGETRWNAAEEKFARAFEAYFHTGQAPSAEVKTLFQRIADGLQKVYGAIMKSGYDLADPVKGVLDKFYTGKEAAAGKGNDSVYVAQGERLFQTAPTIGTTAFERWFGESKVVDEDGNPKVVYHGSTVEIEEFKLQGAKNGRMWGDGFYFTENRADALKWAKQAGGMDYQGDGKLHEVYLSIQNPLVFTKNAHEDLITNSLPEDFKAWIIEKYDDPVLQMGELYPTAFELSDFRDRLTDYAKEYGYDGIIGDFGKNTHYVTFESNQVKSVDNRGTWDAADPRILFQPSDPVESPEFNRWFDGSKVADADGNPITMYHGTTHMFDAFDPSITNPESDMGRGIYMSNNRDDVEANYEGKGPDLTQRIELLAEKIESELEGTEEAEEIEDMGVYEDLYDYAYEKAEKQLHGGEDRIIEAYVSLKNPVIIGTPNGTGEQQETFFDYAEEYDEDTDEYTGEVEGSLVDFFEALRYMEGDFEDFDPEKIIASIMEDERIWDGGLSATDLISIFKESDGAMYAYDEEGNSIPGEILRQAFSDMNFDGVMDFTVNEKFGSQKKVGKAMAGMDEDTFHIIAFRSNQVKSVENEGSWNPNDERILYQGENPLELDYDSINITAEGVDISDPEALAFHNAKVEVMETLYDNNRLNDDIISELNYAKTIEDLDGSTVEEAWEYIGENRYFSEVLEDHMEDEDAEEFILEDEDIFEFAKMAKGTTDFIEGAGYALPDGTLLDFSEGTRERYEDHRQLNLPTKGSLSGTDLMIAFQRLGAMRIDANSGLVDIETKPTSDQYYVMAQIFEMNDGGVLDMADGNRRASVTVENPRKARGVVEKFYRGEDVPDTLFQPSEHEQIIQAAVEDFKPVPADVLEEYSDRPWAQHELKRREILKDYSWLEDWADTDYDPETDREGWEVFRDNLSEAQEFIFSEEEQESLDSLSGAEDRFFKEIWSRVNLSTREERNRKFIEEYANHDGVIALANDVATDYKKWGGSLMPGAIWKLANAQNYNQAITDVMIDRAIAAVERDPVSVRTALATVQGDELEMMQLNYEEEIEEATPYKVKVKRMSSDERMKLYAKTEDKEIRKMLLDGVGTDQETLNKMDEAVNKRISTLKAQQTKAENELKAKLAEEERKVDSLQATLRRKEKEYEAAAEEAKAEKEVELKALRKELNKKRKASEKKIRAKRDEKIKQIKEDMREAQKKRNELKKVKALSRRLAKNITKKPAKTCHVEFKKKILELQEQIGLDPNYRRKSTLEEFAQIRERVLSDPAAEQYYRKDYIETAFKKSLNDWTLQELELVNERMNYLRREGRQAFLDDVNGRRSRRDHDVSHILLEILDRDPVGSQFAEGTKEREKEKKSGLKRQIDIATLTPGRIFRDLAGEESRLSELFDDEINAATDQELGGVKDRQKKMAEVREQLGIKDSDLIQEVTGPYGTFTVDQVIHMWTVRDNVDNMKAIIHGNKISNPRLYTDKLTDSQKAYGDALRADFEEHRKAYAKAIGKYTHGIMGIVEKGYFPMYRRGKVGEVRESELMRDVISSAAVAKAYAKKDRSKSRIKIRDEFQTPIELGASMVWMKGMTENEHFIAFADKIRYLQSIVDNAYFQKGLTEAWGSEIVHWFKKYVNDVAEPTMYKTYDGLSQYSKMLRQNRAMAYLCGNALTVLKQFGSFSTFFRDVPPQYMLASAANYGTSHKKIEAFIKERDPQMVDRIMERELEELKYAKDNGVVKVVKKATGGMMKAISWMDKNTVMIGWKAAYDYQIKKGKSEAEAVRYAQRAVLETQPSARAKDLAQIYRSGEGYNWFLMFTNQLNKNWNIFWSDIPRAIRNHQMGRAVASFSGLLVSIYAISLVSGWQPWEEEEPEDFMKSVGFQTLKGFLGFVPFVGGAASSALNGWSNGGVDPFPFAAPLGHMIREATEGDWEGVGSWLPEVGEGAGTIAGLPVVLAKRAARAAGEISEEEYLAAIAEFIGYHGED